MSDALRRQIHQRLESLRLAGVEYLPRVAAPDFGIELAARVLGVRTLDLADPWAELEAAQVLRDGAFAHDLIYESALAWAQKHLIIMWIAGALSVVATGALGATLATGFIPTEDPGVIQFQIDAPA